MKNSILFLLMIAMIGHLLSCKKDNPESKATVLYESDFDTDDGHWYIGTTANNTKINISNGYYNLTSGAGGGWDVWLDPVFTGATENASVECTLKLLPNGADNGSGGEGGLAWNIAPGGNADGIYYFNITWDGYYSIYYYDEDSGLTYIVDWKANSKIKQQQFNNIKITLRQRQLHFFINGTEVHEMPAIAGYENLDRIGLAMGSRCIMQVDHYKATFF